MQELGEYLGLQEVLSDWLTKKIIMKWLIKTNPGGQVFVKAIGINFGPKDPLSSFVKHILSL